MLTLIIQIVADRRFCGLSTSENLCRELIYRLAIGDATRSQLVKALPRDLSKNDQVQEIIDRVAIYSNPSGLKQGKYSLRKAYWKELDLYHPRWNSRDLQGTEERYLRFCKVSALNAQLPRWTKVFDPLSTLCRIPTSRAVLQIVRTVFFYAVFTDPSSVSHAPDGVLVTALHLLSLALDICDKCTPVAGPDISISCEDDIFPVLRYASEKINLGTGRDPAMRENESMLSLLVSLMVRYKNDNDHNHDDSRLCDISSLIESLLKKFAHLDTNCMDELKKLAPHVVCNVQRENSEKDLVSVSDVKERKAKARERQAAILEKMRAEQSKFIASLRTSESNEGDLLKSEQEASKKLYAREESTPICSLCRDSESKSPVSFLILLQKSRLSSFVDRRPPSWDEINGSDDEHLSISKGKLTGSEFDLSTPEIDPTSRLLQLLRSVGHELMYDLQPTEIVAFLDVAKEDVKGIQSLNASNSANINIASSLVMMESELYLSVHEEICNREKFTNVLAGVEKGLVSLPVKGLSGIKDVESVMVGGHVTPRGTSKSWSGPSDLLCSTSKSATKNVTFERFGPLNCDGIHISSCGHAVHQECHDRYLFSLKQRHIRRLGFEGGHIVDPDMGELLCPVCRRFANSILPVYPGNTRMIRRHAILPESNHASTSGFASVADENTLHLSHAVSLLRSTAEKVRQVKFFKVLSGNISGTIEPALEPVLRKLCGMYFPNGYDHLSASGQLSYSLLLWDTLRYSLTSTEIAARGRTVASSDGSHSGLQALYCELQSSNGFILSLLLQAAQASRSLNRLQVLMRFSGIELLAASICSDLPGHRSNIDRQKGPLSTMMERLRKEEVAPDIKFLKQAADPILAHDPFSSLLWVLFCLPLPFASSDQTFVALVHLFYVVCVIQALITCHSKHHFDILDISDCPVNDICKTMGESELGRRFFVSNYFDASVNPKDTIRRFTFPFLRRCALLWKMLKSLMSIPCYDNAHVWDKLTRYMNNDMLENTDDLSMELSEISELENSFQIHSLEAVLSDKLVSALALKWCTHLSEEFSVHNFGCVLYSTPAVPFRLMRLPLLYQDLLQRYVKQHCPECKAVPEEPALCLLCGRLCSPSGKPCCRLVPSDIFVMCERSHGLIASRCQSHAAACGAGVGVFLLIRRTTIILQRSARKAPWPSPYLDAFGEEDHEMHRGKPLYLSDERYSALAYLPLHLIFFGGIGRLWISVLLAYHAPASWNHFASTCTCISL
ncbi:hypothetical protein Taro_033214 [Colocasia esculenta]|uniref:E3 ubiquitin-protein ligase n=1 Tax=Colocasia esculenta TaxID=4460 RepID=A0A843VN97_COLES|nr:hypothetical protein [Colocasia esculenta]